MVNAKHIEYIEENFLRKKSIIPPVSLEKKVALIKSWVNSSPNLKGIIQYFNYLNDSSDAILKQMNRFYIDNTGYSFKDFALKLGDEFGAEASRDVGKDSFKEGESYTSFDICFYFSIFNVQRSIFYSAERRGLVFIKAVVGGTDYSNEWLSDVEFKYYLFSRKMKGKRVFDESYSFNLEILPDAAKTIYLFVKDSNKSYRLEGLFKSVELHNEDDGSKWVLLNRIEC